MAHLVLCEPTELYNILNQVTKLSRLIEPNYLCLLDVRPKREYDESHVITAHRVKKSGDRYLIPESVDLECVRYCVVYDSNTSSLKAKPKARDSAEKWEEEEEVEKEEEVKEEEEEEEKEEEEKEEGEKEEGEEEGAENIRQDLAFGDAVQCGRSLSHLTRHPVQILKGGYQRFSAMYHFLRTQKVIWMPQELDAFMPYPVEIVPGKIYMGDFKQACDPKVQKNLKIKAHVNVCMETGPFFEGDADRLLHIRIQDSPEANILPFLRHACHFLEVLGLCLEVPEQHVSQSELGGAAVAVGEDCPRGHCHGHLKPTLLTFCGPALVSKSLL
ncbi:serine/threonine/tyrosine-interacting-like protein 1 isoform X3 [Erinaceus europaeus]|uniref:Serine/threonine/tyrosine-interacting-like protein 1 isoform X3 n=1 Tax=Erinaceus europaeus TaxID=9365 RepID=A0ABM3VYQ8_ERIEU|nr:serine/threonine/tyrosine-interacting-like protein 1 isoform X3 [Erinaceus europaeus]